MLPYRDPTRINPKAGCPSPAFNRMRIAWASPQQVSDSGGTPCAGWGIATAQFSCTESKNYLHVTATHDVMNLASTS
jgi:hypothetical protein